MHVCTKTSLKIFQNAPPRSFGYMQLPPNLYSSRPFTDKSMVSSRIFNMAVDILQTLQLCDTPHFTENNFASRTRFFHNLKHNKNTYQSKNASQPFGSSASNNFTIQHDKYVIYAIWSKTENFITEGRA